MYRSYFTPAGMPYGSHGFGQRRGPSMQQIQQQQQHPQQHQQLQWINPQAYQMQIPLYHQQNHLFGPYDSPSRQQNYSYPYQQPRMYSQQLQPQPQTYLPSNQQSQQHFAHQNYQIHHMSQSHNWAHNATQQHPQASHLISQIPMEYMTDLFSDMNNDTHSIWQPDEASQFGSFPFADQQYVDSLETLPKYPSASNQSTSMQGMSTYAESNLQQHVPAPVVVDQPIVTLPLRGSSRHAPIEIDDEVNAPIQIDDEVDPPNEPQLSSAASSAQPVSCVPTPKKPEKSFYTGFYCVRDINGKQKLDKNGKPIRRSIESIVRGRTPHMALRPKQLSKTERVAKALDLIAQRELEESVLVGPEVKKQRKTSVKRRSDGSEPAAKKSRAGTEEELISASEKQELSQFLLDDGSTSGDLEIEEGPESDDVGSVFGSESPEPVSEVSFDARSVAGDEASGMHESAEEEVGESLDDYNARVAAELEAEMEEDEDDENEGEAREQKDDDDEHHVVPVCRSPSPESDEDEDDDYIGNLKYQ